ncbi:hypothetical protein ACFQZ4_52665 [Catellatospora coxensis]|uniref:Uncharacterized protein n=1 Tax=Catellatospora coxensis TaxID=310354 RepID=A0A8J3KVY9_9ACTN|nr:hypothetical protein [Catellatospora coxensis]GIG10002.1 hypothetical protein Cco03nite_67020 [Catellatospora coxensis]
MDALRQLQSNTAGLLAQVDESLARWGAPEQHPVWPLLRRTGALPGDAVAGLAGWSPEPWRQQAAALRAHAAVVAAVGVDLGRLPSWDGRAGDAFAAARRRIGVDTAHRVDRMRADAAHHEELADVLTAGRASAARALARVAGSAEAVSLVTGITIGTGRGSATAPGMGAGPGFGLGASGDFGLGPEPAARAQAAATIAAELLAVVDTLLAELEALVTRGPVVVETTVVAADVPSTATTLRVEL